MSAAPAVRIPAAVFVDGEYLSTRVELPVNIQHLLAAQQPGAVPAVCNLLAVLGAQPFLAAVAAAPLSFRVKYAAFAADSDASPSSHSHGANRRLWTVVLRSLGFTVAATSSGSPASAQCAVAAQIVRTALRMPQLGAYVVLAPELAGAEPVLRELRDVDGRDIFVATVTPGEAGSSLLACAGSNDEAVAAKRGSFAIALGASAEQLAASQAIPVGSVLVSPAAAAATAAAARIGQAAVTAASRGDPQSEARDFLAMLDLGGAISGASPQPTPAAAVRMPPPIASMPSPFDNSPPVYQSPPAAAVASAASAEQHQAALSPQQQEAEEDDAAQDEGEPDVSQYTAQLAVLGWQMYYSRDARRYYYHHAHSNTTTWTHPSGAERQRDIDIAVARWAMQREKDAAARKLQKQTQQYQHADPRAGSTTPPGSVASTPLPAAAAPAKVISSSALASVDSLFQRETEDQRGLTVPVAPPAPAPAVHSATPAVPPSHMYAVKLRPAQPEPAAVLEPKPAARPPPHTSAPPAAVPSAAPPSAAPAVASPPPPQAPVAVLSKLPYGWEEGVDPETGRRFYIDHNTKRTTWERPPG